MKVAKSVKKTNFVTTENSNAKLLIANFVYCDVNFIDCKNNPFSIFKSVFFYIKTKNKSLRFRFKTLIK